MTNTHNEHSPESTLIFSLPGWMPKAFTRMPFCFAKRHSRVRIRKRHFGILTIIGRGTFYVTLLPGATVQPRTTVMTCSSSNTSMARFQEMCGVQCGCVARNLVLLKHKDLFYTVSPNYKSSGFCVPLWYS
eukprot:sb/3475018/